MWKVVYFSVALLIISSYTSAQAYLPFQKIRQYTASQMPNRTDSSLRYFTNRLGDQIHYLYPLYQAFGFEARFKKLMGERSYNENLAQALSFAGDHRQAMLYSQLSYDTSGLSKNKQIIESINDLTDIQSINAVAYVTGMAMRSKIVMINEAHDKPFHRAFTFELLSQLYKDGYRYFAMETFNNTASRSLLEINSLTGYYTNEPVAAELARTALQLGYTLVAYEDTASALHSPVQRDSAQAAHLYEIYQRDPAAKMLVHAGYGHVSEMSVSSNYIPMAAAFKSISTIDPLTVNQTTYCEGSDFELGRLYYDALMKKIVIDEPVVLLQKRKPLTLLSDIGYDIFVVHPPTNYISNRPSWLSLGSVRKAIDISPPEINAFFIQAYYASEYDRYKSDAAIPADQTYIRSEYGYFPLYLKPGNYKIVLRDVGYKVISTTDRVVN